MLGSSGRRLSCHRSLSELVPILATKRVLLTVNPWVGADNRLFWQLELCDGGLDLLIRERLLLDLQDFVIVSIAMNIGAKSSVGFDFAGGEVDHSFVEAILS